MTDGLVLLVIVYGSIFAGSMALFWQDHKSRQRDRDQAKREARQRHIERMERDLDMDR